MSSSSFVVISPKRNSYVSGGGSLNSRVDTFQLYQSSPRYRGNDDSMEKVYGYSDRDLYRPGDTIEFAGFVREMSKLSWENTDNIRVDVELISLVDGETVETLDSIDVDDF